MTTLIDLITQKKPLMLEEENIPDIIGKPFNDPFEVYAFYKKDKILKIQKYEDELIENEELNNYTSSSTYCNGNNYLFISGGETKNYEILKKFWKINLKNQEIQKIDMLSPKKNHSMIFIGRNYVFIVGGNDLKTFYYDIENNEMNEWADLNKKRTEPALILVNNYIYCLDNVNSNNNNEAFSLEKTDVSFEIPKWEIINPNMNYEKLNQKFFGISKTEDNNIILLGGNMDEDKEDKDETNYNCKYNISNNTIGDSDIPFNEYNFKEKTFIPYNKNIDYILPDFNRHHPEVIFYQKKKNKLFLVKYEPNYEPKILRNTHRPLLDYKYNFNMPSINLPTTKNIINKENNNINNIEESKSEEKKLSLNGNNSNLDIKDGVDNNILFNSPEIIANKPDNKISINISIEDKNNNNLIPEKEEINNIIKDENKIQSDKDVKNKLNANNNNNLYIEGNENLLGEAKLPDLNNQPINLEINEDNKSIGNIKGDINIDIPKIDIEGQDIKNKQGNITIPSANLNVQNTEQNNIQIPGNNSNFNILQNNIKVSGINFNPNTDKNNIKLSDIKSDKDKIIVPDINLNPGNKIIDTNINIPENNNEYNIHLPIIESKLKVEFNTLDKNLQVPANNINGPNIKTLNNKSDFYMSGIIQGFNETGKININESNINIHNSNNLNNNINIKGPKLDINGPTINTNLKALNERQIQGRDFKGSNTIMPSGNINGNIPNVNIQNSKKGFDMKDENGIKNNFYINGIIPGIKSKEKRINMASTKIDINKPKIESPELKINGNVPDININAQNPNINFNKDLEISGIIPGKKQININAPNIKTNMDLDLKNTNKIDINGNHKMTNSYMSGIIQGINNKSNINVPDMNLKGQNLKTSNINIKGNSTEFGINSPQINLPSGNVNIKSNNNIKVNGTNHELKMNPEFDIKKPELDINGPIIPKVGLNVPNSDINVPIPSSDINLETSKLNNKIDINGNLPKIKIDEPNVNIRGPILNIKGPNLDILNTNPKSDYYLSGIIEGKNLKESNNINGNMNIKGPKLDVNQNLPYYNNNDPKIGINGLKSEVNIKGQNTDLIGFIPGRNVKDSNVNNPSGNINIRRPEFKHNINGKIPNVEFNMKDPNFSESKINGNFGGNINLKGQNQSITGNIPGVNIDSQKMNIYGPNVNFKESNLSSNHDFFLSGLIPSKNDKNKIIIIKGSTIPKMQISTKEPSINPNGDYNFQKKINFHGNLINNHYLENENEIKGSRKLRDVDDMNNINIENPKIDIKINNNLNLEESNKKEIEDGNLGGEILLKNKPNIDDIKNDNQFGINANIDGGIKTEDINIDNLGMHLASEELLNSAVGENGVMKKKGKGLPMVGNKSSNFKASKIDSIGNFDADNFNVNNMKSANVGVSGQKMGERIVE